MRKVLIAGLCVSMFACGVADEPAVELEPEPLGYQTADIIRGTPTTETPAVVALYGQVPGEERGALCTATVVAPTVVLTAAHCVHPDLVGADAKFVVFTATDLTDKEARGPGLPVKSVHWHPRWSRVNLPGGHDVAVAILESPLEVTPMPVNRASLPLSMLGQPARIIGYGLNDGFAQTGAGIKRHATVRLNSWDGQFVRTGNWFGTTICSGDSGGPILVKVNGVETVVGVNSFGFIFCIGEASSTRPDSNLDFLQQFLP